MSYFSDENIGPGPAWHPDTRTVDELLFPFDPVTLGGGALSVASALDAATQRTTYRLPYSSTEAELYRKPGMKAGVIDRVPYLERIYIAAGFAPENPNVPIGNIPTANRVQVEIPRIMAQYPLAEAELRERLSAGPNPSVLDAAASTIGVSSDALKWLAIGTLLLVLPLVLRK